jgi:hypothetical protein
VQDIDKVKNAESKTEHNVKILDEKVQCQKKQKKRQQQQKTKQTNKYTNSRIALK